MDLNEFAKEIHENAVKHGWWPEERTDAEVLSLVHSEWSEALEAYRNDEPMVYRACEIPMARHPCEKDECGALKGEDYDWQECSNLDAKPEGVGVELIDGVIRLLDAAAAWHITIPDDIYWTLENVKGIIMDMPLPNLVMLLHNDTSRLWNETHDFHEDPKRHTYDFASIIGTVWIWLKNRGIDPEEVMVEKHEYNLTRPYKHGGKKI